mmetsp:Transcript_18582/g.50803  ORF Transcript_18582/g.50803 Transcript_18582/m.50803 type:complete len:1506 (+) Transcript_18582:92-4609(+)
MDPNSANFDPRGGGYGAPQPQPQPQYSYDEPLYAYNVATAQHMPQQQQQQQQPTHSHYDVSGYNQHHRQSTNYNDYPLPGGGEQQALYYGDGDESGYYSSSYQPGGVSGSGAHVHADPALQPQQQSAAAVGEPYPIESLPTQLTGTPISALAYDNTYDAIFVASETQSLTRGRFNHRASMLLTHSTTDGMLYSSVAGHPEAPPLVLKNLYGAIYSTTGTSVASYNNHHHHHARHPHNRRAIPSHAFQPNYGDHDPALPDSTTLTYQMGIRDLLPLGEGFVASASPAGVRIHAHGGLQTADFHTEGMLAMTAHPNHQGDLVTHITAGGMALPPDVSQHSGRSNVLCLDIYQGLRVIASHTATTTSTTRSTTGPSDNSNITITALETSQARSSVIAGGSDGRIRVLDSRLREVACTKAHLGGVVDLALSSDGNLLATCGYGSRGSSSAPLYSFPDPNIYCFDLRYLGRGGIPHPFAGIGGGPRNLSFLPDMDGVEQNRLMAVSGRVGGGIQVIVPFEEAGSGSFLAPQLDHAESITAMHVSDEGVVGLGTSKGNLLQYRIAEYKKNSPNVAAASGIFIPQNVSVQQRGNTNLSKGQNATSSGKKPLKLPSFNPPMPELSLESKLLLKRSGERSGPNDKLKSIFSSYVLARDPTLTSLKEAPGGHFGPLGSEPMVEGSKNELSESMIAKTTHSVSDFVRSLAASELELDLLKDHRPQWVASRIGRSREPRANPNKFLYQSNLYTHVYKDSFNRFKKRGRRTDRSEPNAKSDSSLLDIPSRYRLCLRPTNKSAAAFSHTEHNNTGLFPGWDYPPTMPNAFVPPVLMLLYFFPEARATLLRSQFMDKIASGKKDGLIAELSFVFHRIDSIARHALVFPSSGAQLKAKLGAWSPSNFVSCLGTMAEAEQLQILDDSPAAVESPRRPEAFYRFLQYQIDKELGKGANAKMMDKISGVDFISVNEFISQSTAPTTSSTRAMTVDLYYENFVDKGDAPKKPPSFGEVLYRTLSRETRLRAFNKSSGSYETIVQRKIATSLPSVLSLSCACAGRKEEDGLFVWRGNSMGQDHWLPEKVEIAISDTGNILVSEYVQELDSGTERWVTHGKDDAISNVVAEILAKRKGHSAQRMRYELSSVLSLVRDDLDRNIPDELVSAKGDDKGFFGHHVLHTKIPDSYRKRTVDSQVDEANKFIGTPQNPDTVVSTDDKDAIEQRAADASVRQDEPGGWVLFNGFKVSNTSVEDARAFHVEFKEPCIIVYRSTASEDDGHEVETQADLPVDVMCTRSLTNNSKSEFQAMQKPNTIPGHGDLVAFDAEFVSLQEEVSAHTEAGSRITIQETRHALARISAVACKTKDVVFDDFVTPGEEVADYLTRFSGIIERDLNPKESSRHLIPTRAAYLKLRCLVERGCIFVGHGLDRDFWTANLMVPANQIIDTVMIYHKPAQRYVSLRFLSNFVLKKDMQQEVHDSLEDATAAFELYETAVELKRTGEFSKLLDELYEYGQKVDWKLGIE